MKIISFITVLLLFSFTEIRDSNDKIEDDASCYLQLIKVKCITQEDWSGTDQIYFTIDGEKITTKARIKSGQSMDLKNIAPIRITNSSTLELLEYDWDSDDSLASTTISCNVSGRDYMEGQHWTANYIVYYNVY